MANYWVEDINKAKLVNNTFERIMWKSVEDWSQFRQHIQLWLQTFEPSKYVAEFESEGESIAGWLKYSSYKYDSNVSFDGYQSYGKDREESSTAKFERSMQNQIEKITEHLKNSNYKYMIKELKTLAKMLKYSKHYIGKHRPLYKYDQVRQAFSGLSDKITESTKLIEEKIEQINAKWRIE